MIVIFDLDDTLYPEITYVYSGFNAVALFLANEFNLNSEEVNKKLCAELESSGRGKVFDKVLSLYGLFTKTLVKKCVHVYRTHEPKIKLDSASIVVINQLQEEHIPIYLVTDGNKVVQNKKVEALGLYDKFKKVFITHRYGLQHSKPSPYCFYKIAERESVEPQEVIYIADNPNKDFVGIKPHGFNTVRINQGMFKNQYIDDKHKADVEINSISEVSKSFLKNTFNIKCPYE